MSSQTYLAGSAKPSQKGEARLNAFPLLRVLDFLLLFLGLGHGVNGLKHIIDDRVHKPGARAFWLSLLLVTFTVFLAAGTAVLFVLPTTGGA